MTASLKFVVELPDWADLFVGSYDGRTFASDEAMVRLAIEAAALNVRHKSGGPFGAAVFSAQGKLISIGVNLVEQRCSSVLHAEVVALALAQDRLKSFTLNAESCGTKYILASSAAPCVMCFGAIHWSGIDRLIVSAAKADVEAIGFDEGPIPEDWIKKLESSGVAVATDCCRNEGKAVLEQYRAAGATIYNSGWKKR